MLRPQRQNHTMIWSSRKQASDVVTTAHDLISYWPSVARCCCWVCCLLSNNKMINRKKLPCGQSWLLNMHHIFQFSTNASRIKSRQDRKGGRGCWAGTNCRDPAVLHMFLSSILQNFLATAQINPFRPNPSHSATDSQSFLIGVKIFSQSALGEWPEEIFSQRPESLLGSSIRHSSTDHAIGNRGKGARTWTSLVLSSKRAPHAPWQGIYP